MRLRSRSYERFANYLLLRKLETSPFGDCWRAAPIEGLKLGSPIALRRFPPGDPELWRISVEELNTLAPFASSSSISRGQRAEIFEGTPFLTHRWEGGRPLSVVADRAFSPQGTLLPIPVDLAMSIAEKIAHSLAATHATRREGASTIHGALLPHLVWISEEGDVRVAGQGLGRALVPAAAPAAGDARTFFAPEVLDGEAPKAASDIYSAGAILHLLLVGRPLPDSKDRGRSRRAFTSARLAATGEPVPADIAGILERTLADEPAERCDAAELHRQLSTLVHSEGYTATTFNLAYFMQTLLRDDLEAERRERETESQINVATAVVEDRRNAPPPAAPDILTTPAEAEGRAPGRWIAVAGIVMLLAAAATAVAWYSARAGATDREKTPATQRAPSPAPATATIVAAPTPAAQRDTATTVPADDSAAREAAFEQEVNRRLREEMVKLQRQFDEEQRRQQAARLPLLQRPAPAPQSAAAGADPASSDTATEGPERQLASEGQLFDLSDVDQAPTVLRSPAPAYPQAAARQQLESSVIVTALISETGRVLDARVLRGDGSDAGFDEAAVAAVRTWEFTPGIKDGQRIRTWVPVNVDFRAPR